jgi:hypothetical protein
MADRVSASITIGGTLSSDMLGDFLDRVAAERLSPEWDGAPFEMADLIPGKPIALYAHEVAWGCFELLENWCVDLHLPFVRWCDGSGGSWGAQRVIFFGAGEPIVYPSNDAAAVLIDRQTAEALGSFAAILAHFEEGAFVPPPFVVVPGNPDCPELSTDPIPDVG